MAMIKFEQPQTLEELVMRAASVKLKIAAVHRRQAKDYQRPDVPVDAGVALVHLNMLATLAALLDFDADFGAELEPVPGSIGRFKDTDPNLEPADAELMGMVSVRGVFETVIVLEELISRINELFDRADNQLAVERQKSEAAYHAAENVRMEGSRRD